MKIIFHFKDEEGDIHGDVKYEETCFNYCRRLSNLIEKEQNVETGGHRS